jgi:hypothetical protein
MERRPGCFFRHYGTPPHFSHQVIHYMTQEFENRLFVIVGPMTGSYSAQFILIGA